MNKKINLIKISQRSKSNKTFTNNYDCDSENLEIAEKTSRKKSKSKTKKSKSKKKKRNRSSKGIIRIPNLPNLKELEMKLEEKEEIEFVLGDFNDFHSIEEIQTFKNMTSLTLINESIKEISSITDNLPNPSIIKFLCLNQNEIDNLNGIEKLENIETLHLNFNYIDKIPSFFPSLKKLKTFWISDNSISVLENLPIELENLWIANNEIEEIPENFSELINLEYLNISGNFINDLKDLYVLGKIKKLKRIYLCDINFGENPICLFNNYRKIMVHIFNYVEIIDQIKLTFKEKTETEKYFIDNIIINNDKIKQNYKICKMIFRLMKTYNFFCINFELYKIKALSLKLKELEYNLYEKNLIEIDKTNETNTIENEIKLLKKEIDNCLYKCNNMKNNLYYLKNKISNLSDLSIVHNFYKLETNNNIKIEDGNLNDRWVIACLNLMKYQLSEDFMKKNKIEGISINQIYKIKDKKAKFLFNALQDDLIEEYDKFGVDEKLFKFFFMILPEEITQNKRKLFQFLFENKDKVENIFFCDNYTFIDEYRIKKEDEGYESYDEDKKNHIYTTILCKCSFFEKNIEIIDCRCNFFSSMKEIKNYLINLKSNSNKDIVCLKLKNNINFYYYTNKGLFQPKYIIEYNYKEIKDKYGIKEVFNFKSSFDRIIKYTDEKEKLFNTCSRYMFDENKNISTFINNEAMNKYYLSKFFDYKELDNNFLFFIKNSLINYLNNCFRYNNEEEFLNEIKVSETKINEIKKFSNEKNFMKLYDKWILKKNIEINKNIGLNKDNKNEEEKNFNENYNLINNIDNFDFCNLKCINLFNTDLTDKTLNNFLNKIRNDSLKYNEILQMAESCEELLLSKNNLTKIELSEISKIFPNLKKIDISHNNLINITYITTIPLPIETKIKYLDISYNNINNFSIIIKLIKIFNLGRFLFYANPFERKFEKYINYYQNGILNKEIKDLLLKKYDELLKHKEKKNSVLKIGEDIKIKNITKLFDYVYNCYSFSDEYRLFNDCIYFRDTIKYDNETQINIAYLNNKNLMNVPIIEGNNDIQIIYLNSNKICKISNLIKFNNLKELFLQNNKIKIIENLPKTIKKLDLSDNYIDNLSGIEILLYLEWVNLENNNIKNISLLINLINLVEIYCSNNLIDNFNDYSQFGKLKNLEILDLSGNEIINNNKDIKIMIIYYCPNLKFFNRNYVTEKDRNLSIDFFTGKLTIDIVEKRVKEKSTTNNIIELDLSSLKLKDEKELFSEKAYPKLKKLNLSKNNFSSFIIFGNLPELIDLNLSNNSFIELFPKKTKNNEKYNFNISNLIYLDISYNQIANINGIQYFNKLKKLNLKENSICKIDSLDKINELYYINISYNKLRSCDKTNIGILPSLKIFLCDNNYLKDINCFEKFYSLEIISFNNNKITNIGCLEKLSNLKKLTQLSIINNPITKIVNYRKIIIYIFQNLKTLDNKEVNLDERVINIKNDNNINNNTNNNINNNINNHINNKINNNTKNNNQNFENYTKDDDSFGTTYNNYNYNIYKNKTNNSNSINNNLNISLFKKTNQRVNYVQIGYNLYPYKNNRFLSFSKKKDPQKKERNKSHIMNGDLLQTKKNSNNFNWRFILSNRNKMNNIFPKISKSITLSKSKNVKRKFGLNSKTNRNSSVILSSEKQNMITHRPQSSSRVPNSKNKGNPSIYHNQDYFSIVLNSANNDNNYEQLVTLKNWNVRKINFDVKK